MERELVLGAAVAFGGVVGCWLFLRPIKRPLPPISAKGKTGFWYLGMLMIGLGLMNLLYGFFNGEIFVSGRNGGFVGWLAYDGHKRAFAWFGFVSTFVIFAGVGVIRIYALRDTAR
jgi:hypothetical protein